MTYSHKSGANVEVKPLDQNSEHQKVRSRLTGQLHEIGFGPLPANADPSHGGLLPANPFASGAQQRFAYAHPDKFGGKKGLAEWSADTDFKHLPERKHKK